MAETRYRLGLVRRVMLVAALSAVGAPALAVGFAPTFPTVLETAALAFSLHDSGGGGTDPSGPWPYL